MDMLKTGFPKRFEIYWVNLDPTITAEIKKTKSCVIISPDSMNEGLHSVLNAGPKKITSKFTEFDPYD